VVNHFKARAELDGGAVVYSTCPRSLVSGLEDVAELDGGAVVYSSCLRSLVPGLVN
jgi:hypothetical protein